MNQFKIQYIYSFTKGNKQKFSNSFTTWNKQINFKTSQSDHSDKDIVKPKENFVFTIKEEVDIDNENYMQ